MVGEPARQAGAAPAPWHQQQASWGLEHYAAWAAVAAAHAQPFGGAGFQGPLCWTCNKHGHRMRQCPEGRAQQAASSGKGSGKGGGRGDDVILKKLAELMDLIKKSKK